MNTYIKTQITSMLFMAKNFEQACELAARKDDGQIDPNEAKTLKKIKTATTKFCTELEKLK